jgi:two-component system, NtrC family, response regulator AtoC
LYYRLSGFTVHVPPLRQRREEIPLLLGYFMNRLARHYALPARTFSPAVLSACQFYSWPGNLTELESFVKRYLVAGDESEAIRELDQQEAATEFVPATVPVEENTSNGASDDASSSLKSLVQSVKGEAERNAISTALEATRWNRKAAARLLRVSYRTLLYKIQQYRMSPPPGYPAPSSSNGNGIKGNGR